MFYGKKEHPPKSTRKGFISIYDMRRLRGKEVAPMTIVPDSKEWNALLTAFEEIDIRSVPHKNRLKAAGL